MRILALETSSATASVALLQDGKIISEFVLNDGYTHSRKLVPMIDTILNYLSLKVQDIDYIAASIGPGSFTGLRIGVVTAKSMAMAVGKNTVGVHTLDALAYNAAAPGGLICPLIDARNKQVYTALYRSCSAGELPSRITDYMALPVSEYAQIIKKHMAEGERVIFTGNAALMHKEFFKGELGGDFCDFQGADKIDARASSVARIAEIKVLKGEYIDADNLVPFYLRKSSAEQKMEKNRK